MAPPPLHPPLALLCPSRPPCFGCCRPSCPGCPFSSRPGPVVPLPEALPGSSIRLCPAGPGSRANPELTALLEHMSAQHGIGFIYEAVCPGSLEPWGSALSDSWPSAGAGQHRERVLSGADGSWLWEEASGGLVGTELRPRGGGGWLLPGCWSELKPSWLSLLHRLTPPPPHPKSLTHSAHSCIRLLLHVSLTNGKLIHSFLHSLLYPSDRQFLSSDIIPSPALCRSPGGRDLGPSPVLEIFCSAVDVVVGAGATDT